MQSGKECMNAVQTMMERSTEMIDSTNRSVDHLNSRVDTIARSMGGDIEASKLAPLGNALMCCSVRGLLSATNAEVQDARNMGKTLIAAQRRFVTVGLITESLMVMVCRSSTPFGIRQSATWSDCICWLKLRDRRLVG